jgi:hypothetical protein
MEYPSEHRGNPSTCSSTYSPTNHVEENHTSPFWLNPSVQDVHVILGATRQEDFPPQAIHRQGSEMGAQIL